MSRIVAETRAILRAAGDLQHLVVLGLLVALYFVSTLDYLAFHSLIEIFTVIVGSCIFVVTWNSREYAENSFFMLIGIAYLFVSAFDMVHLLAYKGMDIFAGYGADLSTQLWIAGRYVEALALLGAAVVSARKIDYRPVFLAAMAVTGFLFASIFYWKIFPACYVEGIGLTPFKIYSEYLIAGIMLVTLFLIFRHRQQFEPKVARFMCLSLVLAIASGLLFTLYTNVYDLYNFFGHALRLLAFYLIFLAIVQTGLKAPYDLIFRSLKKSEDALSKANTRLIDDIGERKKTESALRDAMGRAELYLDLMSHDINNLNQIGMSSLELAMQDQDLDEETREMLARALGAFTGSSKLISNVKKLQQASDQTLEQGRIDLGEILDTVAMHYRGMTKTATIGYEKSTGCYVKGNELLYDVFSNLVGNAIKHAEGPVEINISISRSEENDPGHYTVEIADNGKGIPDELKKKIFERFSRGQTRAKGSGLGLYLVRAIVESHGGKVRVENRVHGDYRQGCKFVVMLPSTAAV